jgi:hypothetical protein
MIYFLAEKFKMGFNDFRSHATNIRIFENPSSVKSVATEVLQPELVDLR